MAWTTASPGLASPAAERSEGTALPSAFASGVAAPPNSLAGGSGPALFSALTRALTDLRQNLENARWPGESAKSGAGRSPTGASGESPLASTTNSANPTSPTSPTNAKDRRAAEAGGLDLDAPATLAPGGYTLDYMAGAEATDPTRVVIHVHSGDTWRDVLQRLSRALGAAGPGVLSRLVPVPATPLVATAKRKDAGELPGALGGALAAAGAVGRALGHAPWPDIPPTLAARLVRAGVTRAGGELRLSPEGFAAALAADPTGTRAVFAGPEGLLPLLARAADALASGGAGAAGEISDDGDSAVSTASGAPAALGASPAPDASKQTGRSVRAELAAGLDRSTGRLVDARDAGPEIPQEISRGAGLGALLRRRG